MSLPSAGLVKETEWGEGLPDLPAALVPSGSKSTGLC